MNVDMARLRGVLRAVARQYAVGLHVITLDLDEMPRIQSCSRLTPAPLSE